MSYACKNCGKPFHMEDIDTSRDIPDLVLHCQGECQQKYLDAWAQKQRDQVQTIKVNARHYQLMEDFVRAWGRSEGPVIHDTDCSIGPDNDRCDCGIGAVEKAYERLMDFRMGE